MKPGFTLLEVLVAATIISLLSGISLVGYNRFQERQQLASAKEQLRNDLRQTQQKALAGEKPSGWCAGSGVSLQSWRLEFVNGNAYQLVGVCSDGSTVVDKTASLFAGATLSAGDEEVEFQSITGAASDSIFTLRLGTAGGIWESSVDVTTAGLVQSSAILATTSTPAPIYSPTPTPTSTPTPIPTPTPTPIPTITPVPTVTPTTRPTSTPIPTSVPTPTSAPVICTSGGESCTSASQCCSNSCILTGQSTYCAQDGENKRGEWVCREWRTATSYACRKESCTASGGSCSANWNCCSGVCNTSESTYCARDGENKRGEWVCREWRTETVQRCQ